MADGRLKERVANPKMICLKGPSLGIVVESTQCLTCMFVLPDGRFLLPLNNEHEQRGFDASASQPFPVPVDRSSRIFMDMNGPTFSVEPSMVSDRIFTIYSSEAVTAKPWKCLPQSSDLENHLNVFILTIHHPLLRPIRQRQPFLSNLIQPPRRIQVLLRKALQRPK